MIAEITTRKELFDLLPTKLVHFARGIVDMIFQNKETLIDLGMDAHR